MKIEMGESLVYSWLRHVMECQIVQNNWKPSAYWPATKTTALDVIRESVETAFAGKYDIFKQTTLLSNNEFELLLKNNLIYTYIKPDEMNHHESNKFLRKMQALTRLFIKPSVMQLDVTGIKSIYTESRLHFTEVERTIMAGKRLLPR